MKISISDKNSKLGKIPNISLTPIASCPNCSTCKSKCYALKAYRQYPASKKAWDNNLEQARMPNGIFFIQLDNYLASKKPKYFRIHVAGDFFSQNYLDNWKLLVAKYPDTKFLAFTKSFHLDYSKLPKNLKIIFSVFKGMNEKSIPLTGSRSYAGEVIGKRKNETILNCTGKCDQCGICWQLPNNHSVYFDIH